MAAAVEGVDAGLEVVLVRVGIDLGEDRPAQASGFEMPAAAQASASSEIRPAPKRMAVG